MATIGRKDLILLLVGLSGDGSLDDQVNGVTRLQKLLFLLQEEAGLRPSGEDFAFTAWKAGPYSAKLYDDIEFLVNLGLLEADTVAEATEAEVSEAGAVELQRQKDSALSFEYLMGSDQAAAPDASIYEEKRFRLSPKGVERVKALLAKGDLRPATDGIRKIKSRYSKYSLNDLLFHVYTNYPSMTVASGMSRSLLRIIAAAAVEDLRPRP